MQCNPRIPAISENCPKSWSKTGKATTKNPDPPMLPSPPINTYNSKKGGLEKEKITTKNAGSTGAFPFLPEGVAIDGVAAWRALHKRAHPEAVAPLPSNTPTATGPETESVKP